MSDKAFGSMQLVAGTAIGASMLALPFPTAIAGFGLSMFSILCIYLFSAASLLLYLEINLYSEQIDVNLVSIVDTHLGPITSKCSWALCLILLYLISTSYISGGADLLRTVFADVGVNISTLACILIFTGVLSSVSFISTYWIDQLNRFLMATMMISFVSIALILIPTINLSNLGGGESQYWFSSLPIIVAAFSCHFIVPSVRKYMESNDAQLLQSVLIKGLLIPLALYLTWEFLVNALLPFSGQHSLSSITRSPHQLVAFSHALQHYGFNSIDALNTAFSFSAIVTSFLGVILSSNDLLADGLKLSDSSRDRIISTILSIVPPLALVLLVPKETPLFQLALEGSGLVMIILFTLLPVTIAWRCRYVHQVPHRYELYGGKAGLAILGFSGLVLSWLTIGKNVGWVISP